MKIRSAALLSLVPLLVAGLAWAASAGFLQIGRHARTFASTQDFPHSSRQLTVDAAANRISLPAAGAVELTALAGPRAYMMSFQIDGLTNPEIQIPKGTLLTLTVINVDDDMNHDLRLIGQAPPYGKQVSGGGVGTTVLKPHQGKAYAGSILTLRATGTGSSYYVCTTPGHAKAGMYGKIIVTPAPPG